MPKRKNSKTVAKLGPIRDIVKGAISTIPVVGPRVASVLVQKKNRSRNRRRKPASSVTTQYGLQAARMLSSATNSYAGLNRPPPRVPARLLSDPQGVARVNAQAFLNQLRFPGQVSGMRLPTPDKCPTGTFSSHERFIVTNATMSGTNNYAAMAGMVLRPFMAGGNWTLSTVTSNTEVWTQKDDYIRATAAGRFGNCRCTGMMVRVWLGNATNQNPSPELISGTIIIGPSQGAAIVNYNSLTAELTQKNDSIWDCSVALASDPREYVWDPISLRPMNQGNQLTTTTTTSSGFNGITFNDISISLTGAAAVYGEDQCIVVVAVADASSAISPALNVEVLRHYEGEPEIQNLQFEETQVCFGSESELDYAEQKLERYPPTRRASYSDTMVIPTVSQILYPTMERGAYSGGSGNYDKARVLRRILGVPKDAKASELHHAVAEILDEPFVYLDDPEESDGAPRTDVPVSAKPIRRSFR